MVNIRSFFKREKYIVAKIIIAVILSFCVSIILENIVFQKYLYEYVSIDRIVIISLIFIYFSMYFILKPSKINEFIYRYRYYIAITILLISVVLGYSGSSILEYDQYIQPDVQNQKYEEILGMSRSIRSDEWAVNTPLIFSQSIDKIGDKFSYYSDNLRGTDTDMFTVINAPVLDIVSIGKIFNIGYLFGNRIGLSFWWNSRLIVLIMVSFELFMLLTNKNKKISVLGMILVVFSPVTQWWYSNFIVDILIWGSLSILLVDKFMTTGKFYVKILSAIGIGVSIVSYIFTFYPAWIISFGYVYLGLFIWVLLKNIKSYKISIKDIIMILSVIIFVLLIGIRYYMLSKNTLEINLNTSYPGERFVLGGEGDGKFNIFSYIYSMLLPIKSIQNPCELSSMYSLFPLPIIISILLIFYDKFNRKENLKFLIPILFSTLILAIWIFIVTNNLFAKLTFLYMVPCNRCIAPLGFSQILLLLFSISRIDKEKIKLMNKEKALLLSLILVTTIYFYICINLPNLINTYITPKILILLIPINILVFYITLSYNNDVKYNKYFYFIVGFIVIFSGILVNPIVKGVDVIYEKPVSKKVQAIVESDSSALWLSDEFIYSNYLVANGAKVINSTNYYPNFEMLKLVLGEEKFVENREIYNRYAHIMVEFTNNESHVELMSLDAIRLFINIQDLKLMNVKYILTSKKIEEYFDDNIFEKIYDEYGMRIYKVNIF